MKKIFPSAVILIFISIIVFLSINFVKNPNESYVKKIVVKVIPKTIKNKIKILIANLNVTNTNDNATIENFKKRDKNFVSDIKNKDNFITNTFINSKVPVSFNKTQIKTKINNTSFFLSKFSSNILSHGQHTSAQASAYLDIYNDSIIISSKDGSIFYFNMNDLSGDNLNALSIPSNIKKIITYNEFYTNKRFGVKDALIFKDKIYISYTNQMTEDCYNTSVIVAEMNYDFLKFKNFFNPPDCVRKDNIYGEFSANSAGGKIFPFKNDMLIFTQGEYRYRTLAQDLSNSFGKILAINDKNWEILSYGHRNPQGLYYDLDKDIIVNSEHGPDGGDEININHNPSNSNIKNYGWPISSYGKHYYNVDKKYFDTAPLHKSHKDYGFQEPIHYYTPSIATSEIIKIPNIFFKGNLENNNENFFLSSLGYTDYEKEKSIYHIQFNNNLTELISENQIKIGERIRDLKYIKDIDKIILFLDNTASIAVIEK